jgi:hypothetical protein
MLKIVLNGRYLPTTINKFSIKATQIRIRGSITSIHTASVLDFGFMMNNVDFVLQSLIQSKLPFQRDAGSLIAPDTITANKLLDFARYEFDLSELYARKLRKEIYEQKGTFLMSVLKLYMTK